MPAPNRQRLPRRSAIPPGPHLGFRRDSQPAHSRPARVARRRSLFAALDASGCIEDRLRHLPAWLEYRAETRPRLLGPLAPAPRPMTVGKEKPRLAMGALPHDR